MATLGELKGRVLRLLDNPTGESYTNELLLEAVESAYMAVLPWRPKPNTDTITGDGSAVAFVLPTDLYEIQAITVNESGEMLPSAVFHPGSYHGEDIDKTNDWIEYPSGSVTFSKALDSGEVYDLWYTAYWTPPDDMEDENDVLEVPEVLITAVAYYSSAYALMPGAVSAADIRQWNIDVDSGTPAHNPVRDAVTYLMNMFQQEMNRVPKFQRSQR
jgi:hypothetical protein